MKNYYTRFAFAFCLASASSTVLTSPASSTEIVFTSCPEGMIVVGDKRRTITVANKTLGDDSARKVMAVQGHVLAVSGTIAMYRAEARSPKGPSISEFDLVGTCAQCLFNTSMGSLLDQNSVNRLNQTIGSIVSDQLNRLPFTASDEGKLFMIVVVAKPIKALKRIELLAMDFFVKKRPDGSLAVDINNRGHFYDQKKGGYFIAGCGYFASDRTNFIPPSGSLSSALTWAENDIRINHRKVLLNGVAEIGDTVDEFLIGYDGTIKPLQLAKRLEPVKTMRTNVRK